MGAESRPSPVPVATEAELASVLSLFKAKLLHRADKFPETLAAHEKIEATAMTGTKDSCPEAANTPQPSNTASVGASGTIATTNTNGRVMAAAEKLIFWKRRGHSGRRPN